MKTPFSCAVVRVVVFGLAFAVVGALCANAPAQTVPPAKRKAVNTSNGAAAIGLLDQAYTLLETADHDYKGHRAHAMHAIQEAAKELGQTVGGHGKGGEAQGASDGQLQSAESLLQQAQGQLTGRPLHHVQRAISELGIALSVK